jgi:hypothetical protein
MAKLVITKLKAKDIGECSFCGGGTDSAGALSSTMTIYLIKAKNGLQIRCCSECLKELKKIRIMRTIKE